MWSRSSLSKATRPRPINSSRRKAMALEVRRIVTGHDSQGKAVVATDERLAGTGATGRAGISRVDVWSTDKMPIDNSDAAAELQRMALSSATITSARARA